MSRVLSTSRRAGWSTRERGGGSRYRDEGYIALHGIISLAGWPSASSIPMVIVKHCESCLTKDSAWRRLGHRATRRVPVIVRASRAAPGAPHLAPEPRAGREHRDSEEQRDGGLEHGAVRRTLARG